MGSFQFNPTEIDPQSVVEVDSKPSRTQAEKPQSDRLASAKARALDLFMKSNPTNGEFGPSYDKNYYKDFQGPESSWYAAASLVFKMKFIDAKFRDRSVPANLDEAYNPRTGIFQVRSGPLFSISDLQISYIARIAELGISEILLTEWLGTVRSVSESRTFFALPFEQRMQQFKK